MQTETRMLKYTFTREEHLANAQEMARLLGESAEIETEHKQVKAALKEREESVTAKLAKYGRFVRDGCDHRAIECVWVMDTPAEGQKSLCRKDTMETVDIFRMTDEDRQRALKFTE